MGGYGSGRHGDRPVAESCMQLRMRTLAGTLRMVDSDGSGSMARGLVAWSSGSSVSYRAVNDHGQLCVLLDYRLYGVPTTTRITVVDTKIGNGAHRRWFLCPRCSTRRSVLYLVGSTWRCRMCHRITYDSCNMSYSMRQINRMFRHAGARRFDAV
jgi:hypothetical protein